MKREGVASNLDYKDPGENIDPHGPSPRMPPSSQKKLLSMQQGYGYIMIVCSIQSGRESCNSFSNSQYTKQNMTICVSCESNWEFPSHRRLPLITIMEQNILNSNNNVVYTTMDIYGCGFDNIISFLTYRLLNARP